MVKRYVKIGGYGLLGLLLLTWPLLTGGSSFLSYTASLVGIYVVLSLGLNILTGYAGQISIGHAAFMAIGAYTSALLTARGVPFWCALPAAGVMAGAVGWLLGFPALRLHGHYLAIATLGFAAAVQQIITTWDGVTGGHMGMKVAKPVLFGFRFGSDVRFYYITLAFVALMVLLSVNLLRSRIGRAFKAIRDSEVAAQAAGISLARYKTTSFGISAAYAGLAGSVYAHMIGYIGPADFTVGLSLNLLAAIVVGGLGSVPGSIYGGIFIALLPMFFSRVKNLPYVLTGVVLIAVVLFLPYGLASLGFKAREILSKLRRHGGDGHHVPIGD